MWIDRLKLAGKIVFFVCLIWASSKLLDHYAGKVRNSYNKKNDFLEQHADSIQVLVLGSSQALYGIDPAYFSKPGFNLANVSQSLEYDLALTRKFAPLLPKLKFVIIPVSYWSLDHHLSDGKEGWRAHYYHHCMGVSAGPGEFFDVRHYSQVALYSSEKFREYGLKKFRYDLVPSMNANGFIAMDTVDASKRLTDEKGKKRVGIHDSVMYPERYAEVQAELEEMIAIWNKQGVHVILVTPPVYSTYSKYCRPSIVLRNHEYLSTLTHRYDCSYKDYFNDGRFLAEDYYDCDHLNARGARKFSRMLDFEVISQHAHD